MEELDLRQIIQIFIKRWWIIVASTLLFGIVSGIISFFFIKPVYQSNTTLYIGVKKDMNNNDLAYNDLMVNSQLVKDYQELVKSRLVARTVLQELKLGNLTVDQLSGKLGVDLKNETRFIEITAQDKDPRLAMDIANKVADVFQEKVVEKMQVENVNVIDRAELPQYPVKPNKKLNVAIALILGLVVGFGIAFLIDYMNNTIKTPDDIKKYVGLPVIGTIPVFPED